MFTDDFYDKEIAVQRMSDEELQEKVENGTATPEEKHEFLRRERERISSTLWNS